MESLVNTINGPANASHYVVIDLYLDEIVWSFMINNGGALANAKRKASNNNYRFVAAAIWNGERTFTVLDLGDTPDEHLVKFTWNGEAFARH